MDLRIERTRRSIINAFIELRSKKSLEKITIKELSDKSTKKYGNVDKNVDIVRNV